MDPIVEEFTITLKYQVSVDTETGEMITKCISRKIDKSNFEVSEEKAKRKSSKTKIECSNPVLILEDNKYCLSQAAIELMNLEPDCKLDIKYEKDGKDYIPVIGTDEVWGTKGGNKLSKSNSVACRGSKREELLKYGTEFTIIPHTKKDGLFILKSNTVKSEIEDLQDLEEEISSPIDVDLQDLLDDSDIKEVNSSLFQL